MKKPKNFIFICISNLKNFMLVMLIAMLCSVFFIIPMTSIASQNASLGVIVIDAGHGGIDGGSIGANGSVEKELTLMYAKCLQSCFNELGYSVVLTRKDDNGLYSPLAKNKKIDDLTNRLKIINQKQTKLLISLHMNSFSSKAVRGAQVFYKQNCEASKNVATKIKDSFVKNIDFANKECKSGDFYLLNNAFCSGVLIECGFISNPQEEQLLLNADYCKKLCSLIAVAVG